MRGHLRFLLTLVIAAVVMGLDLEGQARGPCPPGQVEASPGHCTFLNVCTDGTVPGPDGRCYAPDVPKVVPDAPVRNLGCKTAFRPSEASAVSSAGCSGRRHVSPRKVFFSNGAAASILEKYLNDAESRSVPIDLDRLSVVYVDDAGKQQLIEAPHLTLGQIFSGKSERELWKNLLAGKMAAARNNPSADAETLGADLACGD